MKFWESSMYIQPEVTCHKRYMIYELILHAYDFLQTLALERGLETRNNPAQGQGNVSFSMIATIAFRYLPAFMRKMSTDAWGNDAANHRQREIARACCGTCMQSRLGILVFFRTLSFRETRNRVFFVPTHALFRKRVHFDNHARLSGDIP